MEENRRRTKWWGVCGGGRVEKDDEEVGTRRAVWWAGGMGVSWRWGTSTLIEAGMKSPPAWRPCASTDEDTFQ